MAGGGSLWRRWWLAVAVAAAVVGVSDADPQTNLLNDGCSQFNATNVPNFFSNLNTSFSDLRRRLSGGEHFATTQQGPVYTMVQCRNYLSTADCLACFQVASVQIRNCSTANGARVIYDGCFLRYESGNFFTQATLLGNGGECGNRSVSEGQAAEFRAAVVALLADLVVATPRINGTFAAVTRELGGSGGGSGSGGATVVYAVAQCAVSVGSAGCQQCLELANTNFQDCPPRTEGRSYDVGCFLRYSDTPFFADNQTTDIRPFLGGGSSNKRRAIIGGVVGGASFLLLIVAFFLWYQLSRKPKAAPRANILGATELRGPENFGYKDLKTATKNFIEENKLGEGGFGDVYKGTLKNGNIVAVKKLDIGSSRAKADFDTEVKLISNVHHRNLIRLLGCSSRGPFLLLVYEYMANGSLDRFLYGERRGTLNWKQRFDIIFGTARGLAYLHEQFHVRIIHRDIKPSNILLDTDFQPKIADFGLARLLPEGQSQLNTRFAGTLGYTAPEYAIHGQLSEKVDTYSFGVVVLEIISGKRCTEVKAEPVTEYLLEQAWKLHEKNMHTKLVDETLNPNEYREEDVKKIIEIALMCTQSPASMRPTMSEVVVLLLSERTAEFRGPNRPTLVDSDQITPADTSINTVSSSSNATASFTEFTGR